MARDAAKPSYWSTAAGIFGAVILVFGVILFLFVRDVTNIIVLLHLGIGALVLIWGLISNADRLKSGFGSRSTKFGSSVLLYSLVFLGVLVVANYFGAQYKKRFDMTEAKIYSLSDQTRKTVQRISKPLRITGFFEEGTVPEGLRDLLEMYSFESGHVAVEFIDPVKAPELAEQYQVSNYGTLLIRHGEDDATAESTMIAEQSEEAITNAIMNVTREVSRNVYFLDGHDEHGVEDDGRQGYDMLRQILENEQFKVKSLFLSQEAGIPEDCTALVVGGPRRALVEPEIKAIDDYLREGGRAVFMIDPVQDPRFDPGVSALLSDWGVELGNDVVVDQVLRLFQGMSPELNPMVTDYGAHPITADFSERTRTAFHLARSVRLADKLPEGLSGTELARSGQNSWAESNLDMLFRQRQVAKDDDDTNGPVPLAVAVNGSVSTDAGESEPPAGDAPPQPDETRLVVLGDSELVTNENIRGSYARDLFLNSLNWLLGEEEQISIRPRQMRASRIELSQGQMSAVFYLTVLIVPELVFLAGIGTWLRRKWL